MTHNDRSNRQCEARRSAMIAIDLIEEAQTALRKAETHLARINHGIPSMHSLVGVQGHLEALHDQVEDLALDRRIELHDHVVRIDRRKLPSQLAIRPTRAASGHTAAAYLARAHHEHA